MQLTWRRIELHPTHPWRTARMLTLPRQEQETVSRNVVVQLTDAQGVRGLGEAAPSPRYQESPDTVEAFLRRVDASRLSFEDVRGSTAWLDTVAPDHASAKCALNIALVDGAARRTGQPVHDLLGLRFEEGRHFTSFSIGIDTPETVRRKVEAAAEYPILKLKLGSPDDRALLAALRAAAPEKRVRVDANEAWTTPDQALRHIEWLARDPHIEFVEQPMPATCNPRDFAWLKTRSPLPLLADESYHSPADIARCLDGFHGVNVKLVKTGGITGAYDALRAAHTAGLRTMIGCMIESSILISAAAHLAELADYLDLDGSLLIADDPYQGATTRAGRVSFEDAPLPIGLRVSERSV